MDNATPPEGEPAKRTISLNPWLVVAAVLIGLVSCLALASILTPRIPDSGTFEESAMLSSTRIHFLETIEAGKNAVLATTDEDSIDFANRARAAAADVEKNRKELEILILRSSSSKEKELITQFDVCWSHFSDLHSSVLDLAVQNTNLKAQKLSSTGCAQELKTFEKNLSEITGAQNNAGKSDDVVRLSYEALTASLHILALHKPHIEEAKDSEMDRIEGEIASYDAAASKALATLETIPELASSESLKSAKAAYDRFMLQTREVLKLSRMNTNIKSTELSLGKQHVISAQCEEILGSIQASMQSRQAATK